MGRPSQVVHRFEHEVQGYGAPMALPTERFADVVRTSSDLIDPDRAVGTWTAPFSVKKPTGDDLPKVGDEIVPMK